MAVASPLIIQCFNPLSPRRARATRTISRAVDPSRGFNPLSPRRARATLFSASSSVAPQVFQSSLAPKGESNLKIRWGEAPRQGFNPLSPRRARATRAQCYARRLTTCFNPLSPRRARATGERWASGIPPAVSILSRPEGREQLPDRRE